MCGCRCHQTHPLILQIILFIQNGDKKQHQNLTLNLIYRNINKYVKTKQKTKKAAVIKFIRSLL